MKQGLSTVLEGRLALLDLRFGTGEAESNPVPVPVPVPQTHLKTTGSSSLRSEERAAARVEELPDVEHVDAPEPDESHRPLDDDELEAAAPAWQWCPACEQRIRTDVEVCPWCCRPMHFDLAEASHSGGIVARGRLR